MADYNGAAVTAHAMSAMKQRLAGVEVDTRWRLLYAGLGVLGALVVLWLTRFGPGMSGDSTSYLMGAENLLDGRGFSRYSGGYEIRPISGFPPFYSFVLASLGSLGLELQQAGRFLNAGLFALVMFLSAHLVFKYSRNGAGGLFAAALVMIAESMLVWYLWIMSEGLYIALLLLALSGLTVYFDGKGGRSLLGLIGLCMGAAALTRYVGLAAIVAAGVALIVLNRNRSERRDKVVDVGVFAAASGLPVILWLVRNAAVAGTATNREFALHAVDPELIRWYLAEVSSWFVPHQVPLPTAIRAALAIILVATLLGIFFWKQGKASGVGFGWSWIRLGDRSAAALPWIAGLMVLGQLGALVANSLFLDAATTQPAVPRYLTPVFVLAVIFSVAVVGDFVKHRSKLGGWISATYGITLLGFYIVASGSIIQDPIPYLGYTGYRMRWEGVVQALEQIEPEQPIVSNNPELVYVLADRPAYVRPIRFDHYQDQFRDDFEQQLQATKERLLEGGVYVVFHPVESVDKATLDYTGAVKLVTYPEATFYGLPGAEVGDDD